ncbi:MAG: transglycosylase [Tardiphaga sp.]|nr:transglycosylase [Tardiphaga sp.]
MAIDGLGTTSTGASSRAQVANSIGRAADTTGTSFQYLLATAKMESNFNPTAKASTSSAGGLFQFIDQTWLGTVKEAGSYFGYGAYADAITRSNSGKYSVSDPAARDAIMKLRDDPNASSAMAGILTQSNGAKLTSAIGRKPTDSELYMAHFMGVGGATKLITNAANNPQVSGSTLFPKAAAANPSIFFDNGGNARSVAGVYAVLDARYSAAANSKATQSAMAAVGGVAATSVVDNAAYLSSFPSARSVTPVLASSSSSQAGNAPIFRSLFQAGDRAEPVSPAVQELWGRGTSLTSDMSASSAAPRVRAPQPLDLFSDRFGAFSS